MTIKTLQQLNDEFLDEHKKKGKSKNHVVVPVTDQLEDMQREETAISHESYAVAGRAEKAAPHRSSVWKDMLFLLAKIAVILLVFVALSTFLFGFERYHEPSMAPAIKDGDLVIFYRYTKAGYLTQDTIMLEHEGQKQVRRVVAIAGDIVDITEYGLVINGALQQEPEIFQKTERYAEGISFPMTVPEGQVFVLGDSRNGATDSRIYGSVYIEDTLGKVMAIIRRRSI